MSINQIIDNIIVLEKGYVNNPNDRGGETYDGISRRWHPEWKGWELLDAGKPVPDQMVRDFYNDKYVFQPRFDDVIYVNEEIGEELVEAGVNVGTDRATKWFQRSLNLYTSAGLVLDGVIGRYTIMALRDYLKRRDAEVLLKTMNAFQAIHYITLAENDPKQRTFIYGWMNHRV